MEQAAGECRRWLQRCSASKWRRWQQAPITQSVPQQTFDLGQRAASGSAGRVISHSSAAFTVLPSLCCLHCATLTVLPSLCCPHCAALTAALTAVLPSLCCPHCAALIHCAAITRSGQWIPEQQPVSTSRPQSHLARPAAPALPRRLTKSSPVIRLCSTVGALRLREPLNMTGGTIVS